MANFTNAMDRQQYIAEEVRKFFKCREQKMQQVIKNSTISPEPQSSIKPSCVKPQSQSESTKPLSKTVLDESETFQVSDMNEEMEYEEESPQYSADGSPRGSSEMSEGSFVKDFDSSPSESLQSDTLEETFEERIYNKYFNGYLDTEPVVNNEWFFNALKRYRQLIQWDIETSVIHMDKLGDDRICYITNTDGIHSVGYMDLPALLSDPKSREIERRYLNLPNLLESKQKILKMRAIPHLNMILATLENQTGVAVYRVKKDNKDGAGQISLGGFIESQYISPNFTYNMNYLLLCDSTPKPPILYDLSTGAPKGTIPFPRLEGPMEPFFVAPHVFGICYTNWGSCRICDVRSNVMKDITGKSMSKMPGEFWVASSSYEATCKVSNSADNIPLYVGLLSSRGRILIYDLRKDSTYCESYLNKSVAGRNKRYPGISLKFCPNDSKRFSISGFDDRVTVYELSSSNEVKEIFEHTGHYNQQGCSSLCTTTDHYWLDSDVIISAADNNSFQMWKFIPLT